jgi:hypothetical protein
MTTDSRECSGWLTHLTRPLRVKNGPTLRTLTDLRAFILREPEAVHKRKVWQCACELLLAAAERNGDIGAVTEKAELALFLEARLLPVRPESALTFGVTAENAQSVFAAVSQSAA